MTTWQQVLALDAKFNNFRAPNNPTFKRLYLRRRSHLLRNSSQYKNENISSKPESISENEAATASDFISSSSSNFSLNVMNNNNAAYLQTRTVLLQQKYKINVDQLSHRSSRPASRLYSNEPLSPSTSSHLNSNVRTAIASSGFGSSNDNKGCAKGVVPTHKAKASKAIVGGTTLGENYAFSGVHHIFDQHKQAVTMLKFGYNDCSLLAISSEDGTVTLCHSQQQPRVMHTLRKHAAPVMGLDWSSCNSLLASCSTDGTLCVWRAESGDCLREKKALKTALACLFHPINSNWIIIGGSDGTHGGGELQVIVSSTGLTAKGGTAPTPAPVTALAFNTHGSILWASDSKGCITAFKMDGSTGSLRKGRRTIVSASQLSPVAAKPTAVITNLEYRTWASREARDPSLLVSVTCNLLLLYSVIDEQGGLSLRRQLTISHSHYKSLRATFPPLMSFHEGAPVVSGSEDGNVLFLDIEKSQRPLINKLQGHSSAVLCPAFNYNESLLATGDSSGTVIVWKRK